MEPPPIIPDIEQQLRDYLICTEKLPIHRYERNQEMWPRKPDVTSLFQYDVSPLATTLQVQRDPNTGEITEFKEVPVQSAGATAKNSMSLNRAPAPTSKIKGDASNIPFWPGGFPDPIIELPTSNSYLSDGLLTIPPGFTKGLEFETDGYSLKGNNRKAFTPSTTNTIDLNDLVQQEEDLLGIWKTSEKPPEATPGSNPTQSHQEEEDEIIPKAGELVPKEIPVLQISNENNSSIRNLKGTEYAILLDCVKPIPDFDEQIPEMAHKYPFKLDIFQKQAILQLEKHNHIFVAAHTSAGKTVVAEYAIALSQKHMTRSIYTSPIKALSNQKYRDFKQIFNDVGLITGDFQINPTASCLIMTTEILRSMLYCGSDVTRDLEYVIFDEVHYINDKERGHVWEQVLILLPAHVCVVLLSATVPNTIEFADWLGRTHQKKVYVVSTLQRPVPLEHYLYTGSGGSTRDNRYLILNSTGWKEEGYAQSKLSITATNNRASHTKQEKTMWFAIMDHLNRKSLLPVVVFTFSRVKCDNNAENLKSLDLTTAHEKSQISKFFDQCIRCLKEPDRNIPQITRMRTILQNGIGVHHSGVLPIIKEVVEMLFQNGLIKLLFATETFAMGVNMPARTVIFDSIVKHDGRERRNLLPAEYIQMAGRAGRRGKDSKGIVIILCKNAIHQSIDLKNMMLGSPNQLISQFRLTYGMVLSILRVESLSVEGMMSRSFHEADHQKKMNGMGLRLKVVEQELKDKFSGDLSEYLKPLIEFYKKSSNYLETRNEHLTNILTSSKALKELTPGRLLLITHEHHINKLAIILSVNTRFKPVNFKVLVLTEDSDLNGEPKSEQWYKMVALSRDRIYCPLGTPGHQVLTISPLDIFQICGVRVKIDADVMLDDWAKRQLSRFADNPPGKSFNSALQELLRITIGTRNINKMDVNLQYMDLLEDLKMNEQQFYEHVKSLNNLRDQVYELVSSVGIPNFEEQFKLVYDKKVVEDERDYLKHNLSNESMTLYPDYQNRIDLLRDLKYIDGQNRVELKGRVACEMGMNELMVTELVLRNILKKLQPAEVAALLSCLVFQAKTYVDTKTFQLTAELSNGIAELNAIFEEVNDLEEKYRIHNEVEYELNIGLVEVVYEWASAKPFAEIMNLTDVQEGLIVRCIQQLNETICDVKNAARLIGDPELQNKMEEASTAIKRDIVFAASLYTQKETNVLSH